MRISYVHFENVGRWILSELIYEGKNGLSKRELLKRAKLWDYDKQEVLKALRGLERDGKLIKVGKNYWMRKFMKKQFVSMTRDELLRVAHNLFSMSEWEMGTEVIKIAKDVDVKRAFMKIRKIVKKFKRVMNRYQLLLDLHEKKMKELSDLSHDLFREQGVRGYKELDLAGQNQIDEIKDEWIEIGNEKTKLEKEIYNYDKLVTDILESLGLSDRMFMGKGFLMSYYIGGKYNWRGLERDLKKLEEE